MSILSRLILHNRDALFGVIAFAVAICIFLVMAWRALRMPRAQREELSRLPFETEKPSRHDAAQKPAA